MPDVEDARVAHLVCAEPVEFLLVRADNNCVSRPLTLKAILTVNEHGMPPFRNHESWKALKSAAASMCDYTESFDRAVISYVNGIEICVPKNDALTMLYKLRPKSILIFFKQSVAGRGNHFLKLLIN